jgi:hypothetical protein
LKFVIEVLKLDNGQPHRILHAFTHAASSVHLVRETMKAVMASPEWPQEANGFRIVTETGKELYFWPEHAGENGRS